MIKSIRIGLKYGIPLRTLLRNQFYITLYTILGPLCRPLRKIKRKIVDEKHNLKIFIKEILLKVILYMLQPPSQKIPNFVQRNISRGFQASMLPSLAQRMYALFKEEINKQVAPTSIWEVFDLLKETSPEIERPEHLRVYIDSLQKAMNENLRLVFAAPPQHGKSFSSLVALAYFCMSHTGLKNCYITYNETRANDVMRDFCRLLRELGLQYSTRNGTVYVKSLNSNNKHKKENSVKFTSIHGSLTGYSIRGLALLDDVIKGDEAAGSPRQLEQAWNFFLKELRTRESSAFSVVCMMTRWNTNDLSGKLIRELKYEYVRLPALADSEDDPNGRKIDEPLWPSVRSYEQLIQAKADVGSYIFESMYQGNPKELGSTPVKVIEKYLEHFEADEPTITTYGIDLAYSGKFKSDYCAIVAMETNTKTGITHITRCMRKQSLYRDFLEDVKRFVKFQPGNIYFCAGGFEEQTSGEDFKKAFGGRMKITQATKNKYTRFSQSGAIVAFNDGWLLMPKYSSPDLDVLEEQILSFSGADLGPGTDDYTDCVSAAYKEVNKYRLGKMKTQKPFDLNAPAEAKKVTKEKLVSKKRQRGV